MVGKFGDRHIYHLTLSLTLGQYDFFVFPQSNFPLLVPETEMGSMEVEKMLKLAEQCLERIKSFTAKQQEPQPPSSTFSHNQTSSFSLPPVVVSTLTATPEKTGDAVVLYNYTNTLGKHAVYVMYIRS